MTINDQAIDQVTDTLQDNNGFIARQLWMFHQLVAAADFREMSRFSLQGFQPLLEVLFDQLSSPISCGSRGILECGSARGVRGRRATLAL
ncbi:hypothetical protein ACU8V3_12905 [Cobetia marina]